ncbi:peptidoglycan editing factor PgeF [Ancylobacter polymorphus]|uniref:Purine nucleoside phosphorylase n=1 Tax=Ancylobacter polymorphus TaxID=223390 RepID=A0A9E7D249_9HYPH|nr:peptidoglycan editing factor PgeF [Ancylobacter polymorphus]UOK69607.1 peptidoglycan editing factor PgeF [Ancylobacter polymorphus]
MKVESPALSGLPGIRHAFFTREGGVSQGLYAGLNGGTGSRDEPAHVAENRARMEAALGVPSGHLLTAWQIHSPDCVIVDRLWDERPKADAVATATPGIAAAVTIADCGPVLFADPHARVVGAAHAGWKGAVGGVLDATLARMEELGARRENIVAAIGPLIRQESYEVGPDFIETLTGLDSGNARFLIPSPRPDHALFDLPGYIAARLTALGVGTIDDLGLDTYADEARFFSYRRATHRGEPDYGRLIAAITLV